MAQQRRSRRQVRDLIDYVDDLDESGDHYDIAFIPDDDDSNISDGSDDENEVNLDTFLPHGCYEQVKSVYNNNQKRLEENYEFKWIDGSVDCLEDHEQHFYLDENLKETLKKKNSKELFELFFSDDIKDHIIEASLERDAKFSKETFNIFIAIIVLSIINIRKSYTDYWSSKAILRCDIVKSSMSRNNFKGIKQNIKLYKNAEKNENDKVWKVRTLYNKFRKNIQQFGWFARNYSIDEVMVKYFGHFGIKQCIRNKPVRFGIKQWAICSSEGFIFDLDIYTGKSGGQNEKILQSVGLGSRVVMKMLDGLLTSLPRNELDKYHIFFDNFFTSSDLMLHLKKLGLHTTGTVRQNRVKEAKELNKKANRGSYIAMHDAKSNINYVTVMDSKPVSMLSTTYGTEPKGQMSRCVNKTKTSISFPYMFSKYNKNMGGVDLHDQHCNASAPSIRGKKWTWCLFLRIIQASITNATVLYNYLSPDDKKGTKDIVEEVAEYYLEEKQRHLPNRKRPVTENVENQNHEMKIGKHTKCEYICEDDRVCSQRTERYCVKCQKYFCTNHRYHA